jgi:hypothetical protein
MSRFIHISSGIYLALIIFLRMMAMPISVLEYSINKNFIASNLCENRLKPKMNCHGKCYLNKKLTKSNESQESQNQKTGSNSVVVDYCEQLCKHSFGYHSSLCQNYSDFLAANIKTEFRDLLFRPPVA